MPIVTGQRINVGVGGLIHFTEDRNLLRGTVIPLGWKDFQCFSGARSTPLPTKTDGRQVTVKVSADAHTCTQAAKMYFHQAVVQHTDPLHIDMDDHSLMIPLEEEFRRTHSHFAWNIEQFAGFAHRFMKAHACTLRRTLAIESSLESATQFALTHGFNLVSNPVQMPHDFVTSLNEDVMFNCTIQDLAWMKQIQWIHPEIWTISAPCKSWSSAGVKDGFHREDGLSMAHSVAQCRIFQPTMIGFEQVQGFKSHPHYGIAQKLFDWAGFTPLFQIAADMEDLSPVRRNRWLAVYVKKDEYPKYAGFNLQPWPCSPVNVQQFDAALELSQAEAQEFIPSSTDAALYFDHDLLPGRKSIWTKSEVINYRIPPADSTLPTFMAAYGGQHKIKLHLLQSHGLFGFFRRQGAVFRFWSPSEISLLHGQCYAQILLKPAALAWQTLGNAITPLHALYVLYHVYQQLNDLTDGLTFSQIAQEFLDHRLKASEIEILQDDCAWYVGSQVEATIMQTRVQYFMAQMSWKVHEDVQETNQWPDRCDFSPQRGLCRCDDVLVDDVISVTTSISPTQPFQLWFQVMPCIIPGEYGHIQIAGSVTWRSVLSLWDFRLIPTSFRFDWSQIDMTLIDTMPGMKTLLSPEPEFAKAIADIPHPGSDAMRFPFLVRTDADLSMYEIETRTTWKQFKQVQQLPNVSYHDHYGPVCDGAWFCRPMEIAEQPQQILPQDELRSIAELLQYISIEAIVPKDTDILVLHCSGPPEAYEPFQTLWCAKDVTSWLQSKGRQVNLQRTSESTWRLLFRPMLPAPSTPISMLREMIFVTMMQKIFRSFQTAQGIEVLFKFQGAPVVRGFFPADMSLGPFWILLKHTFAVVQANCQPRIISSGKLCTEACNFQDLLDRKLRPGTVVAQVVLPILGGGGPTTKMEFTKMVESGIASMFLEYGLSLPQVTSSTTKLMEEVGIQRLHFLLHGEGAPKKFQSFEAVCKACSIPLPEGPKLSTAKAKLQKARDRKQARSSMHVDPDNYQLKDGFFLNADGSSANILQQFSPHSSGVILMNASKASDWLTATTAPYPDELAIFVLGPLEIPNRFPHAHTHAPATNKEGQDVLLNGRLIQLSKKHVKTIAEDTETIDIKDVQIAAVTLWKEDWDEAMWTAIQTAPVKTIKNLLALDGHQGLFGKPWGRVYQDNGVAVDPALASSFQVHGEFESNARFAAMLKRSGFNKIYITPKDPAGKPHASWKVIWLDQTPVQLEAKSATLAGAAGLVKGKKSYGVRVDSGNFAQAWGILKPGQTQPDMRSTAMVFKLQPLPQGITAENLTEWGTKSSWAIKPIKAIGAKQWIVGSDQAPPNLLQFNGQPLLVRQLYQKSTQDMQPIVAGPRQLKPPSKLPKPMTDLQRTQYNLFHTGDPHHDPWLPAKDMQPKPSTVPTGPKEGRGPSGPVADMFQQQDARLHAVEAAISRIQDQQNASAASTDTRLQQVESAVNTHVTQTQQAFESIRKEQNSMHQTIAQAMNQQEQRIASSFDELKQLFLNGRGSKRLPEAETDMRE